MKNLFGVIHIDWKRHGLNSSRSMLVQLDLELIRIDECVES